MRSTLRLLSILVLFLLAAGAQSQARLMVQTDESAEAWRDDLTFMVGRMASIHPNLFWRVTEEAFNQQVETLDAEIPYLTDDQIALGFASLAAHGGGHSYVWLMQPAIGFRLYQMRLYWFSDGLYVLNARNRSLIGSRLVSVGSVTVDEAYERIRTVVSNDNEAGVWLWSPVYYIIPEVLLAFGFIENEAQPNFVLEQPNGTQVTYNPPALTSAAYDRWNSGWIIGLPMQPTPLFQSNPGENFWYRYLDDSDTVYIQYNSVVATTQSGESLSSFSREIADLVASEPVERVVVDLRHNGGGNNRTYLPLLSLLRSEPVNQPGKLFVITGRYTFSAAMNFASKLEQQTEALFVGEPTGSRPNHYGDSLSFTLPNSGIVVNVAPLYLQDSTADDTREWIEPDIPVPLASEDFFARRDPVMEAILNYE